jgi:hypothetical protein
LRAATLTGSSPTGISAVRTGEPDVSWKTESVAFGELTASRRVPSGVSASGCTCGLSKFFAGALGGTGAGWTMKGWAAASRTKGPPASPTRASAAAVKVDRKRLRDGAR